MDGSTNATGMNKTNFYSGTKTQTNGVVDTPITTLQPGTYLFSVRIEYSGAELNYYLIGYHLSVDGQTWLQESTNASNYVRMSGATVFKINSQQSIALRTYTNSAVSCTFGYTATITQLSS